MGAKYENAEFDGVQIAFVGVTTPMTIRDCAAKSLTFVVMEYGHPHKKRGRFQVRVMLSYDVFLTRCNSGNMVYKLKRVKSVSAKGERKVVVKGLEKNVMYRVQVRAYVVENGKKVYVNNSPQVHAYTNKRGKTRSNAKNISVKR